MPVCSLFGAFVSHTIQMYVVIMTRWSLAAAPPLLETPVVLHHLGFMPVRFSCLAAVGLIAERAPGARVSAL